MEPVAVLRTGDSVEAHLVCSRLLAAGFLAIVNHEFSAFNTPFSSGDIRVEVPASQAEAARLLISENG